MKNKYTVVLHIFLKAVAYMIQERGEGRVRGTVGVKWEVTESNWSWQYARGLSKGITYFMCREA